MELQKLSTGQQDFVTLRNRNLIYVDKTSFILELLKTENSFFFLSRPRRFGKSLFISTLKQVFLGNKQYFKGLFIEDKIDWKTYPVLHFDFSNIGFQSLGLQKAIDRRLNQLAESYNIVFKEEAINTKFQQLIVDLHKKTGLQVVILIDEYDKPITDVLEIGENQKTIEHREILRMFYGIIKGCSEHIKFFFMTGISRFSKVSLFSDLNNLTDLTFNKYYNNICGYTKDELESYFTLHIKQLADENEMSFSETIEQIKTWYNGYSWNGKERVYNPFSILQCLDAKNFGNYWFDSGTPKFLVELLRNRLQYDLRNISADIATFNSYDITNLHTITLLFQTGYLTVKQKDDLEVFVLGYPNKEVEQSMLKYLLVGFSRNEDGTVLAKGLIRALQAHDLAKFIETINILFSSIPSQIFIDNKEAYYHSIIYMAIRLCGFHIQAEVNHAKGRLDAVMKIENRVYIFEFKLDKTAEEAIKQIHEKQYAKAYLGQGLEIYLVGINFSSQKKEVEAYLVERA